MLKMSRASVKNSRKWRNLITSLKLMYDHGENKNITILTLVRIKNFWLSLDLEMSKASPGRGVITQFVANTKEDSFAHFLTYNTENIISLWKVKFNN